MPRPAVVRGRSQSYYLPDEVIVWLRERAADLDRSPSNELTRILRAVMADERACSCQKAS